MNKLLKDVRETEKAKINTTINKRLKEFSSFKNKKKEEWFSELCFCLLTSNSRAKTAINIQNELGFDGFFKHKEKELVSAIRRNKHRFHNTKANYIVEARQFVDIKNTVKTLVKKQNEAAAREWLVKNVKGLGYKESSHFLRNVGYTSVAILDRHIINLMFDTGYISEKPKTLNKKKYIEIEEKFNFLASKVKMNSAKLDLHMWYLKTGEVLK